MREVNRSTGTTAVGRVETGPAAAVIVVGERADRTLNTTAVVHEAYLKLVKSPPKVAWEGRKHFLAIAGRAMHQVLVNYAEARNAEKRGGLLARMTFDESEELDW